MKILFIGGNGNISWYCVQKALERGHDIWVLNRGETIATRREIQPQVHKITSDIRNIDETYKKLQHCTFDVVCDFVCYNEQQAEADIKLFQDITKHFVFISSDSVYQRISKNLPYTEKALKYPAEITDNYISGKIKAEICFNKAYANKRFPVTIIRPGYTYDVIVPVSIGHNCFTAPQKFLNGYPYLIAGDGNNLWTFTHSSDFAEAFVRLIENPDTIGEDFHIASDELLTWNEAAEILMKTLKIKQPEYLHIPFEKAGELDGFVSGELMHQRMMHNIYHLDKIKNYVSGWGAKISFEHGINQTIDWLMEKSVRRRINRELDIFLDNLYSVYWLN